MPITDLIAAANKCAAARRQKLHLHLFGIFPKLHSELPSYLIAQPCSKLLRAIHQLTLSKAIIDHKQYHFTTKENLVSIVKEGFFYGHKTLQNHHIIFETNAFADADRENGDADSICFAPYLVDSKAFCRNGTFLKSNAIRLEIDIRQAMVEHPYHQFFKLFDFNAPLFKYTVLANNLLSFTIEKVCNRDEVCHVKFTIKFELKEHTAVFSNDPKAKSAYLFYGNLYGINRFCLLKFFDILTSIEENESNPSFRNDLLRYMESLPENEIKKILVIFAQTLTIFAELNYSSRLVLSKGLITKIHDISKAETLVTQDMELDALQNVAQSILEDSESTVPLTKYKETIISPLPNDDAFKVVPDISVSGSILKHNPYSGHFYNLPTKNFRTNPILDFGEDYFETRPNEEIKP